VEDKLANEHAFCRLVSLPSRHRRIGFFSKYADDDSNALALIHVFFAAPETRGKPLEEMDEVFESGRPAWRSGPPTSRLDQLVIDIEAGEFKIVGPLGSEHALTRRQKERAVASHVEELINQSVLAV
jgi:hypothetical protein